MPAILVSGTALAVLLAGAAGSAAPAAQAAAAVARPAVARPAVVAHRPHRIRLTSPVNTIASFFLSLAVNPTSNFIFDKLGIPTTDSDVRALSAKIDELQRQLTDFQNQVTSLIAQLSLTSAVTVANTAIDGLDTFYRDHFTVIGADLVKIKTAEAMDPPNPVAIAAAMQQYNTDKQSFIAAADALRINARVGAIHKAFEPGAGATGLLRAIGDSLLSKNEYLTRADSENELAIYTYYEENQALAAWMTCEWEIARGHTELVPAVVKEYTDAVAAQRNPDTPNGLPPLLPPDTVLDRGNNPSTILESRHKLMFTTTRVNDAAWSPPGHGAGVQVPDVVDRFNAERWQGFGDWLVPTQGDIFGLFNDLGPRNPETIEKRLTDLRLAFGSVGPFFWSRNSATRRVNFLRPQRHFADVKAYEGISSSDLREDERPRLERDYLQESQVYDLYNRTRGTVLLVRSTGDTRYF